MTVEASLQVLTFNLGKEFYGLDVLQVYEIKRIREVRITKMPQAPAYVEGIFKFREEVIPLLDLRSRFGFSRREIDRKSRIIVIQIKNRYIAFMVDSVHDVMTFEVENISPPPRESTQGQTSYVQGIAHTDEDRFIIILDAERILSEEEQEKVQEVGQTQEV